MSKELEALEALWELQEVRGWNDEEYYKRLDIIENALKQQRNIEEEEKLEAFEIIKEHDVFVYLIRMCYNAEEYNSKIPYLSMELTEQQFRTVKKEIL